MSVVPHSEHAAGEGRRGGDVLAAGGWQELSGQGGRRRLTGTRMGGAGCCRAGAGSAPPTEQLHRCAMLLPGSAASCLGRWAPPPRFCHAVYWS